MYINRVIDYTPADVAALKKRGYVTSQGVPYDKIEGVNRTEFILLREPGHTDDILHQAKIELRKGLALFTFRVYRTDRMEAFNAVA